MATPSPISGREPAFLPSFFRLAAANIISNLMVPLAALIDTAFLGHLADIRHLAGVALAGVIFNLVYWSFGFLRMGTTGTTAQARGRGDAEAVTLIALRNSLMAIGFGLVIWLFQVPIREMGFALLQAEPAVEATGHAYFNARIWDAPAVLLNLVVMGWFLGQAQGRRVIVLSLVGNGGNIVLDYVFIRQWGWASAGAGAATALSQYLMLLVGLGLMGRDRTWPYWRQLLPKIWDFPALQGLFRLNRDILIRTFALLLSFTLFTKYSAALGTEILAANTLLLQILILSAYFIDGIAFATESFAGRFYGSGDGRQLRLLLKLSGGTSVLLGLCFALVFACFPQALFGLLTSHGNVVEQASHFVWWLLPTLGMGAIAYMLDGYFLGLTAGSTLRNATVIAALLGFLPLAWMAHTTENPHLLWAAMTSFMAARALSLLFHVPKTLTPTQ